MSIKSMDFPIIVKNLQKCIKVTRITMIFQYFSSEHTANANESDIDYSGFLAFISAYRSGLAAKVTRIIMRSQCFSSAHTADLNKSDNKYYVFIVSSLLKNTQKLVRAGKS